MGDNEREIQKRKWEKWNKERETTKNLEDIGVDINNNQEREYLSQLTLKIAEQKLGPSVKQPVQDTQLEQRVCKEVEANTCAICFELMVPPMYSPILLFPCGHTFCKTCTLDKSSKLKVAKCPLCRQLIKSHAVNISLQNLICTFSNQKHLLDVEEAKPQQEQKPQAPENDFGQQLKLYKMRCDILLEEQQTIKREESQLHDHLQTHSTVIETLRIQRQAVKQQMAALQKKLDDVNSVLDQHLESYNEIQEKLEKNSKKKQLIQDTLKPLTNELQKYQVLSDY